MKYNHQLQSQWDKNVVLIFMTLFLLLTACQTIGAATEEPVLKEEGPIRIGVSVALTGRRSGGGTAAKEGYEVWVDMINEDGGLLGRPIELIVMDNGSEQETVVTDYEKLITEDKVDLVVGTQSSFLVIPSSEVAEKYGYAYVEPAGGAPEVFDRGLKNLFFAQPARSSRQADPFVLYLLNLPPEQRPQTFAVVSNDDSFPLSVMERLTGLLIDAGMNQVSEIVYPEGTTDFVDIASEMANIDPDLILGGGQLDDSIRQIMAYQAAGYQPRFAYFTSGPSLPEPFRNGVGAATEGVFSSVSWFPDANEYQNSEFVRKYIEKFGGSLGDIPEDAANAFTAGQVLQQAIENTNSIDNAVLMEELHKGTYNTVVGPLSFDSVGAPQGSYMLLQWQGETFVIVGPGDRAELDPLTPPKPKW